MGYHGLATGCILSFGYISCIDIDMDYGSDSDNIISNWGQVIYLMLIVILSC